MNTAEMTTVLVRDLEVGMMLGGVTEVIGFTGDYNIIYGQPQRGIIVRYMGKETPQYLNENLPVLVS